MNTWRLMLLTMIAVLAAVVAPAAASAVPHPEHEQPARGDGPANVDKGEGRGNPGGANGTIKLDGFNLFSDSDAHPNNEPHIGCRFQVDMYGFDEGDVATLDFREWHPTNDKEPILSVSSENLDDLLGEDGAGGGIDIDDEHYVNLTTVLTGEPHPVHGHHVRVDATITSADGTEYGKTKVFWTGICGSS